MKRQIILGLILVLLVGICFGTYFFIDAYQTKKAQEEQAEQESYVITNFTSSNVVKLDMKTPDLDYVIELDDNSDWIVTNQENVNISTYYINTIISYGCSLTATKDLGACDQETLEKYELDDPVTLTFYVNESSDDEEENLVPYTIYLGKTTATNENFYCMKEGSDHVYLIDATTAGYLYVNEDNLRYRYILEDQYADVTEYSLQHDGEYVFDMVLDEAEGIWNLTQPVITPVGLDGSEIEDTLSTVRTMEVDEFDDSLTEADFTDPAYVLTIKQGDTTTTIYFEDYDPTVSSYVKAYNVETQTGWIFDSSYLSPLQSDLDSYLLHTIYDPNITDVASVSFQYEGSYNDKTVSDSVQFDTDYENDTYAVNGKTLDSDTVEYLSDFFEGITSLPYETLDTETEDVSMGTPTCTITYTLNDGTENTVQLVPKDDTTYWAYLNGEFTHAIVRQKQFSNNNKILSQYDALMDAIQ